VGTKCGGFGWEEKGEREDRAKKQIVTSAASAKAALGRGTIKRPPAHVMPWREKRRSHQNRLKPVSVAVASSVRIQNLVSRRSDAKKTDEGISWESKRRGREAREGNRGRNNRKSPLPPQPEQRWIEEQALLGREDEPPQKKQSHRTKTDTKHNSILGFDNKRT
jgi:hypothetical protein